ncbi:MAG: PIN domain-containing protein [Actinobacteria bacterium]|nr:PIN domain-containing protein [Actinomycetota bacterium]
MKVVADTHVLVFYLFTPDRLTDTALDALLQAENADGIVVSAATLADLWYASRKTSSAAIAPGVYEQIQATVLDPTTNLLLQPVSAATMTHFGVVPLEDLRDPFDRFILATALQLKAPLVTADRAIAATGAAEIVW